MYSKQIHQVEESLLLVVIQHCIVDFWKQLYICIQKDIVKLVYLFTDLFQESLVMSNPVCSSISKQ